jgi:hypothetical protein
MQKYRFGTVVLAILFCALCASAQQPTAPSTSTGTQIQAQDTNGDKITAPQPAVSGVSTSAQPPVPDTMDDKPVAPQPQISNTPKNDRLFGVLPNYTTVENEDKFAPLSVKEKFKLSADSMFDPVTFPFIGLQALIGQAENSEPAYGQGLEGYAKRYATSYADAGIGTTMTTSIFPSMLHQDPRYFQLGTGSIWHRALYSLSRTFVTRTDSGSHEFNTSEIAGNAVAAGLSNLYHPQEDRTFSNTMSVWGTDVMWDTVSNVMKEFWPDIRRKLHKTKSDDQPPLN